MSRLAIVTVDDVDITSPVPYVQSGWSVDQDISDRVSRMRLRVIDSKDVRAGMSEVETDISPEYKEGQFLRLFDRATGDPLFSGFVRTVGYQRDGYARGTYTTELFCEDVSSYFDLVRVNIIIRSATDREIIEAILDKVGAGRWLTWDDDSIDEDTNPITEIAFNGITAREAFERIVLLRAQREWYVTPDLVFHYHSKGGFVVGESLVGVDPLGTLLMCPFDLTTDYAERPGTFISSLTVSYRRLKPINSVKMIGGNDEYGIPLEAVVTNNLDAARRGLPLRQITVSDGWITDQTMLEQRGQIALDENETKTFLTVTWHETPGAQVGQLMRVYARDYGIPGRKYFINTLHAESSPDDKHLVYSAELGEFKPDREALARYIDSQRVAFDDAVYGRRLLCLRGPTIGDPAGITFGGVGVSSLEGFTAFTMSGWFYFPSTRAISLFTRYNFAGSATRFQAQLTTTGAFVQVGYSSANLFKTYTFSPNLATEKWYFATITYSGGASASSIKVYLNTVEETNVISSQNGSGSQISDTDGTLVVLSRLGVASGFAVGDACLLSLWDKVLGDALLARLYRTFDIENIRLFEPASLKSMVALNEVAEGNTTAGGESVVDYSPLRLVGVASAGMVGQAHIIGNAVYEPDYYSSPL